MMGITFMDITTASIVHNMHHTYFIKCSKDLIEKLYK